MAITLSVSHTAAANAPTVQFQALVRISTPEGVYGFARERLTYGGTMFQPRLLNDPRLEQAIALGAEVSTIPRLTLRFADTDGWFARRPRDFWLQHSLSVQEVFLDVSTPVREYGYLITETAALPNGEFEITAESALAQVFRRPFPSDRALLTRERFPEIPESDPVLIRPIPWVMGDTLSPALRVNDVTSQGFQSQTTWFRPGVGSSISYLGDLGEVDYRQVFNGGDAQVASWTFFHDPNPDGRTQIVQVSPAGNPVLPHFVRMRGVYRGGTVQMANPAMLLYDALTHPYYGAGLDPSAIDTPSFDAVRIYFQTQDSHSFHGAIVSQIPVRDLVDGMIRDSLTYLVERNGQLFLTAIKSTAPVASFYVGNILAGTLTARDLPLERQFSDWTLEYHDRTTTSPELGAMTPNRLVRHQAGSGAVQRVVSLFLGEGRTATKVVRHHAQRAADGTREYEWQTTVKAIGLEPGDLVSLTVSRWALGNAVVELHGVTHEGPLITVRARSFDYRLFDVRQTDLPAPPDFPQLNATLSIEPQSSLVRAAGAVESHTIAYSLTAIPNAITQGWRTPPADPGVNLVSSLSNATLTSAIVLVKNNGTTSVRPADWLYGWTVRVV